MADIKTVGWFSGGVSSAVAIKLMIDNIDHIVYQHINDQHNDTLRFLKNCEAWYGQKIIITQSHTYMSVEEVCLAMRYINGPTGAPCTRILKRRERKAWERENLFFQHVNYVWGFDANESNRADNAKENMRENTHYFPLIKNDITKKEAHGILEKAEINRPKMYDFGYNNNNCIGCVKGGMGYWNKIRMDFPEVFNRRAKMERTIGASCINGIYLDKLDPKRGNTPIEILPTCDGFCEQA